MSLLGSIGIEALNGSVNIAVGTVILEFTPYQARTIIAEIRDAIVEVEGQQAGICATMKGRK